MTRPTRQVWALCGLVMGFGVNVPAALPASAGRVTYYVATHGNDRWSGTLADPNAARSDGPFATLVRARDAVRQFNKTGRRVPVDILIRGGTYYLAKPLVLTPDDSGTKDCPITYGAYRGEKPVLSGGRRITGWRRATGPMFTTTVPAARNGRWVFRQLRVGDRRQIRARYPNYDPARPYTGGWLFAGVLRRSGAFNVILHFIGIKGDYLEYTLSVPATGKYKVWLRYSHHNVAHSGLKDMGGRTTITIDRAKPVPLVNMPDTGSWSTLRWTHAATLQLSAGKHHMRWDNVQGGGLGPDAYVLTDDPNWKPVGYDLTDPAPGRHLVVVQAEAYDKGLGKEGMFAAPVGATGNCKRFDYDPGSLRNWKDITGADVHVFPRYGWVSAVATVERIDTRRHKIVLAGKGCNQAIQLGNRYFIEGFREALDAPGEWCLDSRTGRLDHWPTDPTFARHHVVAPVHDRVIHLKGEFEPTDTKAPGRKTRRYVRHVRLQGLTITDTTYSMRMASLYYPDDAAVWLDGAQHCVIRDCTFTHIGGWAARLNLDASDNRILNNTVAFAGQGGVYLNGRPEVHPTRNTIAGNHIHHCGLIYKHVAGVYLRTSNGNRIANNLIHHMPRYGISWKLHSARNVVEYNHVHHVNLETHDTGGIESWVADPGNVIRGNLIHDSIGLRTTSAGEILTPEGALGIYMDDLSSGTTITGNIVLRSSAGSLCLHGGKDNVVTNNILVDGRHAQLYYSNIRENMKGNRVTRNIVSYSHPEALLVTAGGWTPHAAASDYNLYFHTRAKPLLVSFGVARPQETLAQWRARGQDTHTIVADPMFVDPAKDDYRLKPESPAFKLGFKPIDVTRIGLGPARAQP